MQSLQASVQRERRFRIWDVNHNSGEDYVSTSDYTGYETGRSHELLRVNLVIFVVRDEKLLKICHSSLT